MMAAMEWRRYNPRSLYVYTLRSGEFPVERRPPRALELGVKIFQWQAIGGRRHNGVGPLRNHD